MGAVLKTEKAAHSNLVTFRRSMLPPPGHTRQGLFIRWQVAPTVYVVSHFHDITSSGHRNLDFFCVSDVTQYSN